MTIFISFHREFSIKSNLAMKLSREMGYWNRLKFNMDTRRKKRRIVTGLVMKPKKRPVLLGHPIYVDTRARGYSALLVDSLLPSIVPGHTPRDNPVYRATPRYGRRARNIESPPRSLASPHRKCPRRRRRAHGTVFLDFHISTFSVTSAP